MNSQIITSTIPFIATGTGNCGCIGRNPNHARKARSFQERSEHLRAFGFRLSALALVADHYINQAVVLVFTIRAITAYPDHVVQTPVLPGLLLRGSEEPC